MTTSLRDHLNNVTNMIVEKFNEHPTKFGMTYKEHFLGSMYYGACSMVGTIVFMFHAIFPFLFQTTGSNIVAHLHEKLTLVNQHCAVEDLSDTTKENDSMEDEDEDDESDVEHPSREETDVCNNDRDSQLQ
jgi:hypothetical protein